MYNRAYQRSLRPRKLEVSASYTCLSLMWGILASHILEAQPVSAWVSSSSPNVREHPDFGDPCLGAQVPLKSGCSRTVEFPATPKTHSGTTSPHNPLQITKIDRCEESPSHEKYENVRHFPNIHHPPKHHWNSPTAIPTDVHRTPRNAIESKRLFPFSAPYSALTAQNAVLGTNRPCNVCT